MRCCSTATTNRICVGPLPVDPQRGQAYGAVPGVGLGVEGVGFGVFEEAEAVIAVPVPGVPHGPAKNWMP